MKIVAFLICFFSFYINASATDTIILKHDLYKAAPVYSILVDKNYTYQQAVANFSNKSLLESKDRGKLKRSLYDYWTGLYLQNNSSDTILLVAEAYIKEAWLAGSPVIVCGNKPCNSQVFPLQDKYADIAFIAVPPGTHLFVTKISDYNLPVYFAPMLSKATTIESKFYLSEIYKIFLLAIVLGVFLIVAITSFSLSFIIKDKALLWYSLYCTAIILSTYLALQSTYKAFYWSFAYVPWIYTKLFVRVILLISYAKFAQHFIGAKINMPKVNRLFNIYIYACIASLLPEIILLILSFFKESYIYYFITRMVLTISGGIIIASLWKHRKDKYVQFILAGSSFIIIGEFASNLVLRKYSPQIAGLGAFIEIIIFTFGVAYRVYAHYKQEKKLSKELLQKEKEVTTLFKENSNLNMSLFQNQMNPHFIFNSLNSIKEMILVNKNDDASIYLSKFGHLIRLNLEHSGKPFITIKENNEQVKAYLEMESLRFNNFKWNITIDEDVDVEMLIPPMLVQPLAENAIWHGLLATESSRLLNIHYCINGSYLICSVDDNGVGIIKAKKNQDIKTYKSIGINNTKNRVLLLKEKYKKDFSVSIADKSEIPGYNGSGTVATISIPVMYKNE